LLEQFLFKYEKQMPAVMKSYAKEVYKKRWMRAKKFFTVFKGNIRVINTW
jgi:hypothetical protein